MATLDSKAYNGRYYRLTVEQSGTSTALNYSLESIGGSSNKYAVTAMYIKINGVTVWSMGSRGWDHSDPPSTKGTVTSGTYDPGSYGTFSIELSGQTQYASSTPLSVTDSITTVDPYTKFVVNSWSGVISPNILNLRSSLYCNVTAGSNPFEYLAIRMGTDSDHLVTSNVFHTGSDSYSGLNSITATGYDIRNTVGLGSRLYTMFGVYDSVTYESYDGDSFVVPSDLFTAPSITGNFVVTGVTQTGITLSFPSVSNWVRSENSAYYSKFISYCQDDGTPIDYIWNAYKNSDPGTNSTTLDIDVAKTADMNIDPQVESISDGLGYSYHLHRGTNYVLRFGAATKFLGVRTESSSGPINVYIPYVVNIQSSNCGFIWQKLNGRIYRVLSSSNVVVDNPNNEYIGTRSLSLNGVKTPITSQNENIWNADTNSANNRVEYKNQALNLTPSTSLWYASNHYSEDIIQPSTITGSYQVSANLIKITAGDITIGDGGKLIIPNVRFDLPDNTLGMGTMTATVQTSKNESFSSIEHQQTKTITALGTDLKLFDDIQLSGSDLGTNYVRIIWNLSSSSDYYNVANVITPTKQFEFTSIAPSIGNFTVQIKNNLITANMSNVTGEPKPKLYVEVSRQESGESYETFEIQEGVDFTLPYNEPGTIWYIKGRAINVGGETYAKIEGTDEVQVYTIEIPYSTTPNYDEVANPRITASKIQLDGKCVLGFNWVNIQTDVYRVIYNIHIDSTNKPITPVLHEDKQSGYNYTFNSRKDAELVSYTLECILQNSFGDAIVTYLIQSEQVELDAVDLEDINYTFHTVNTYHSIEFVLDTIDKNNNKLVNMEIKLTDLKDSSVIYDKFIGDIEPTLQSPDLDPIESYLMDNLESSSKYKLTVTLTGMNPADASKKNINTVNLDVSTKKFEVYGIKNDSINITNTIDGVATILSDFELSWDKPDEGVAEVIDYIVAYRKSGQTYSEINVTGTNYVLTSGQLMLQNNDTVYIKIGAHYKDHLDNDVIVWKEFTPILLATTNYVYYGTFYPQSERSKKFMFRASEFDVEEEIVKNIYIDK